MKYDKWNALTKSGKKERVFLIVALIFLLAFSPLWNKWENKKIEERIANQEKTLVEDLKGSVSTVTNLPKDVNELKTSLEKIEVEEEKGNTEGNGLETEVDKKQ